MLRATTLFLLGFAAACSAYADDGVRFKGDLETGRVQRSGSTPDGFFVQTLKGVSYVGIGGGGAAESSGLDTRVVRSERVGSETVRPRKGGYFLRSAIYRNKPYAQFPGNSRKNKPRSSIGMTKEQLRSDYDEEGYLGFSIYTPRNYEHETGVKGDRGTVQLLSTNATTSSTFFVLNQYVGKGSNKAHWWLKYYTNDSSTKEGGSKVTVVDLGAVDADLGKWTDFVIRYRANPFRVSTNPARKGISNAMDRTFQGNKGILQVWKAEGSVQGDGDRRMVLQHSKVNTPIGLVPHKANKIRHSFRVYKYGWHEAPTNVAGPVWFGFDEIRLGMADGDKASFADVYPAATTPTDPAEDPVVPADTDQRPKPPNAVVVTPM